MRGKTSFILLLFSLLSVTPEGFAQCGDCQVFTGNMVPNGDFSEGNVGFTTEYELATEEGPWGLLSSAGTYAIGTNASDYHDFFAGLDHTSPGTGSFMMVNGSNAEGIVVWCQTFSVEPDTDYDVSFWGQNIDTNPNNNVFAQLQLVINGTLYGTPETINGDWEEVLQTWYSGNNTELELCILNVQASGVGNDFGIDDIDVSACEPYTMTTIPYAGDDIVICSGETAELVADFLDDFSYQWSGNGLASTDGISTSVTLINPGVDPVIEQIVLMVDSANMGCAAFDTLSITINPLPQPDFGPNVIFCEGDSALLSVGPDWEAVEWETGETTEEIWVDSPGNYTATVTLLGCEGDGQLGAEYAVLPDVYIGLDQEICSDEEAEFTSGLDGIWSTGAIGLSTMASQTGWIWFTYEDQGCTSTDSAYLTVTEYPDIYLGNDFDLCINDTVLLVIPDMATWDNGVEDDMMLITEPGIYSVEAANGPCASFDQIEVTGLPLPEMELGDDQILCINEKLEVGYELEQNHYYLWSDGTEEFTLDITETGMYHVEVGNQCDVVKDSIYVFFEDCDYAVYVPNAFTPDGDGINDVLQVQTLNLREFKFWIFDRWGKLVFYTEDPFEAWQGDVDGGSHFAQNDIYVYKVKGLTEKRVLIDRFGYIALLR